MIVSIGSTPPIRPNGHPCNQTQSISASCRAQSPPCAPTRTLRLLPVECWQCADFWSAGLRRRSRCSHSKLTSGPTDSSQRHSLVLLSHLHLCKPLFLQARHRKLLHCPVLAARLAGPAAAGLSRSSSYKSPTLTKGPPGNRLLHNYADCTL